MEMTCLIAPVRGALPFALLQEARTGSAEALGRLFEGCRPYLLLVARRELRVSLRAKLDAADLVQDTFIEAQCDFIHFRGETETQLLGWLRGILRHNLMDATRRFHACCRCLAQEVRLLSVRADSASRGSVLVEGRTACEKLIAKECRRAIDDALEDLPPSYRRVFQLRYDERQSFAEIGLALHRSPEAVRKLWGRALQRLRHQLREYRYA
jgi:RNA polymerase sigma-70 factor (subfamily 1)